MVKYQEHKINLKTSKELTHFFPCPLCKKELEAEKYQCNNCKIELTFFLPYEKDKN